MTAALTANGQIEMYVYVFISAQSKAFGLGQFSNQQAMNIKQLKITQNRTTGGHLVDQCLLPAG